MDFNSIDKESYNKYTFGKCLKQQRVERGYSAREFARLIGISVVYLCDIEKGKRYAPTTNKDNILEQIIMKLNIPEEQLDSFYEMAMASRGYSVYKDYLEQDDNILKFIKTAYELEFTKEEWKLIFNLVKEISDKKNKIRLRDKIEK